MTEYILDGEKMRTKKEAHEHIAAVLGFPEYYGHNLDALFDVLSERRRQSIKVVLTNGAAMREGLGAYGELLVSCFEEAFVCHGGALFTEEN